MAMSLSKGRGSVFRHLCKSWRILSLAVAIAFAVSLVLLYGVPQENTRAFFSQLGASISFVHTQTKAPVIPKKIWYKLGPKGLSDETRAWTTTCIEQNPDYEVEFMTDESADSYVRATFGNSDPDLVEVYLEFSIPILKADLLRYLLLFSEGGVYFDLDVSCHVPINEWVQSEHETEDASIVVGWEFDVGWGEHFTREFATWTIMSRPRSPHMWAVIQDILHFLQRAAKERGMSIADLTLDMIGDVVDATGPRRFTRSIMRSLKESGFENATVNDVKNLIEPKMAGDVLVLPGWAFAASANHYQEGMELPSPLITHHYAGSWKNDKGGE